MKSTGDSMARVGAMEEKDLLSSTEGGFVHDTSS